MKIEEFFKEAPQSEVESLFKAVDFTVLEILATFFYAKNKDWTQEYRQEWFWLEIQERINDAETFLNMKETFEERRQA